MQLGRLRPLGGAIVGQMGECVCARAKERIDSQPSVRQQQGGGRAGSKQCLPLAQLMLAIFCLWDKHDDRHDVARKLV